jgi:hypothetical protein
VPKSVSEDSRSHRSDQGDGLCAPQAARVRFDALQEHRTVIRQMIKDTFILITEQLTNEKFDLF